MTEAFPAQTLADLRREIDRIDDAMHRLLMERGEIIDRLIATKGTTQSGAAFRPEPLRHPAKAVKWVHVFVPAPGMRGGGRRAPPGGDAGGEGPRSSTTRPSSAPQDERCRSRVTARDDRPGVARMGPSPGANNMHRRFGRAPGCAGVGLRLRNAR